jgi:hypothetical protein
MYRVSLKARLSFWTDMASVWQISNTAMLKHTLIRDFVSRSGHTTCQWYYSYMGIDVWKSLPEKLKGSEDTIRNLKDQNHLLKNLRHSVRYYPLHQLSIYLSMNLCIYLIYLSIISIYPSVYLCMYVSIYLIYLTYLSICLSIYRSIDLSIYLSIDLSIDRSI